MSFDAVAEVLRDLRLSSTCYWRGEFSQPWGLEIPARCGSTFHLVVKGSCYLRCGAQPPLQLHAGDLVLLPHDLNHILSDSADRAAVPADILENQMVDDIVVLIRHGGGGEEAVVVGSTVQFEDPGLQPLLALMPDVIHIPASDRSREAFHALVAAIGAEALSRRPGGTTVMTRLVDALVIQIVRWWLDREWDRKDMPIVALRDPHIGRVLVLIHRQPQRRWTVRELAREAHMSRSVFAERFRRLLGVSPMQYVTRHRMRLAARWVREDKLTVAAIAMRLGYESEPSFSRAFRRERGVPPSALRRQRQRAGKPSGSRAA